MGFAYLIFEVDRCIEVWDLGIYRFAHHLAFTSMDELSHLYDRVSSVLKQ